MLTCQEILLKIKILFSDCGLVLNWLRLAIFVGAPTGVDARRQGGGVFVGLGRSGRQVMAGESNGIGSGSGISNGDLFF